MFSLLFALMQSSYAQDAILVDDVRSTQSLTYDFETVYRKNLEGVLMNTLSRNAYRIVGSINLIPEMEKTKAISECMTANCEINMAKAMGIKYVVSSEYTVLEDKHHLAVVLSDAQTNAMVLSQSYVCPDASCVLNVKASKITKHLNAIKFTTKTPATSELPKLPRLPEPKTLGNIALAAAVIAPIAYIFVDNISNINK
tara:strand:- start:119 stop:715 length:597 start_codon:yes stop_codon:yes gene_type:complete